MASTNPNAEDQLSAVGRAVEQIVKKVREGGVKLEPNQNEDDEDTDDWAQDEDAYDDAIRQIESIDLTEDSDKEETSHKTIAGDVADESLRCHHSEQGVRNPCLCGTHDLVRTHTLGEAEILDGKVYALDSDLRIGRYLVDFIDVKQIWRHKQNGSVMIRGAPYSRTRNLDGRVEAYKNEVCRVLEVDTNDPRDEEEQSIIEVVFEDLRPHARTLHLTNKPFPECRFDDKSYATKQEREDFAPLTCRWAQYMFYPDKRFRHAQRPIDGEILAHLGETDVRKQRHRASDEERLRSWRGETIKGGSYKSQSEYIVLNLNGHKSSAPRKRYNAADMFSGAGGYTTGAKSAGIRVERAVDHWTRCNATYKANHPEVALYEQDIMAHCNDLTIPSVQFDLVHLSPPCQTWSPAHTCAGKNDGANIAALSACQHIVSNLRPRILTFEQTFGIIQERHLPFFNALVQSLTKFGYSLKWKVICLVGYGLPQTRKRLIMIGAAPGEKLPPFPVPTHAAEPDFANNRKRFVSAIKACWGLVDGVGMHNPSGVKQLERVQWDGTQPMNRTITTSGGQAYHWEGQRDLTLAEFARLQGFPETYIFKGPCIKKQIGNAFPPIVVSAIMKQLVAWLEKVDSVKSGPNDEDIVTIDDGDDDGDDDESGAYQGGDGQHDSESKHEYTTKHDHPGSSQSCEDINSCLTEDEAMMAAMHQSLELATSQNRGGNPAAFDGPASSHSAPSPKPNTPTDYQAMNRAQRAHWVGQLPQGRRAVPRRSNSCSSRRRQSSEGSSVIYCGLRQLATIIEDEDNGSGENSGSGMGSGGQAQRSSSVTRGLQDNGGQGAGSSAQGGQNEEAEESSSFSGNFDKFDEQQVDDMAEYGDMGPYEDTLESEESEREAGGRPLLHDRPTPPRRPWAPVHGTQHSYQGSQTLGTQGGMYGGPSSFHLSTGSTRFSASELAGMDADEVAGVLGMYYDDPARISDRQPSGASGAAAPPGSPTAGQNPPRNATGTITSLPSLSDWVTLCPRRAQASSSGQAGPSGSTSGAQGWDSGRRGYADRSSLSYGVGQPGPSSRPPRGNFSSSSQQSVGSFYDASKWQDTELDESEVLARAMEASIQEAVQGHEEMEEKEELNTNTRSFIIEDQEDAEPGEEAYEGKGKGKAIAKRCHDGAADDAEEGSSFKRGRTE